MPVPVPWHCLIYQNTCTHRFPNVSLIHLLSLCILVSEFSYLKHMQPDSTSLLYTLKIGVLACCAQAFLHKYTFFWWLQMNTSLLGIKTPIFGQAKHTFRTGAVWNAHLECATALKDPEHQKSNKLGFRSTAFAIFLARALIFSGCQASTVTALVWSVLVLLTYQTLVEFSKLCRSGPTNIRQR